MQQAGMDPMISEACEFLDELGPDKMSGFNEVPWVRFRSRPERARCTQLSELKTALDRTPWDAAMMIKALVMGSLNNLSDEKLTSDLRVGLPLMRFIGVKSNSGAPRAKTLRTCRDALGEAI